MPIPPASIAAPRRPPPPSAPWTACTTALARPRCSRGSRSRRIASLPPRKRRCRAERSLPCGEGTGRGQTPMHAATAISPLLNPPPQGRREAVAASGAGSASPEPNNPLRAGLGGLDLQRAQFARHHKVAVVEQQRARDAVLI